MLMPNRLADVLKPYYRPDPPAKQGRMDYGARGRVFYMNRGREIVLTPDGRHGYHATIITKNGESYGDGPYYNNPTSAAEFAAWMTTELAAKAG